MPRRHSPCHLRLDWLMWFAAISTGYAQPWITRLCEGMLSNDPVIIRLLRRNPFPDKPPRYVRALLHHYRFSTAGELVRSHAWWHRKLLAVYLAPMDLDEAQRLGRR
jgi:hypothetical protein